MGLPIYEKKPNKPQFKKIIAIAAGKGGVGKSTVAVNLALAFAKMGQKVGLIDADVYGPSIEKMMPFEKPPIQKALGIDPAFAKGVEFISMGHFRKNGEAAAVRAPIANGLIAQFISRTLWNDLDYLIVDFPPGTGDIQLTICQQLKITGALVVTTPQEVALLDVRKAIALFDLMHVPLLGVVENMSYFRSSKTAEPCFLFGKGGGKLLAEEREVPLLGQIPIDEELCRSADAGLSLFDLEDSYSKESVKVFFDIAEKTIELSEKLASKLEIETVTMQDAHHFLIKWSAGYTQSVRFSDLQRECPCAGCVDETTGKRVVSSDAIDPYVSAKEVEMVGRYGLKVAFTSGCSKGIYTYEFLEKMRRR